jgi:hypothetical protein
VQPVIYSADSIGERSGLKAVNLYVVLYGYVVHRSFFVKIYVASGNCAVSMRQIRGVLTSWLGGFDIFAS